MKHSTKENLSHLKVLLFFALIGAEILLTQAAGENFGLNAVAVVITAYATYQLDNIYNFLLTTATRLLAR